MGTGGPMVGWLGLMGLVGLVGLVSLVSPQDLVGWFSCATYISTANTKLKTMEYDNKKRETLGYSVCMEACCILYMTLYVWMYVTT